MTEPIQAVSYTMMREFYANAWVMESKRHLPLPYTSMIRGKKIDFSPGEIHKVLNLHNKPLPNVASYHDRKNDNDLRMNNILRDLCVPGAQWVMHDDGRPHFLRRTDLQPMARGWYEFVTRSIMPTTNRSEVSNKRGIRSKLPFPGVIQRLCNEAKASIPEDTMIPVEPPINANVMERRFDAAQEENRKSFSDIHERMDKMDHQLNFLCNTNQFMNEDFLYPY
ncbi:hypothetical protein PIB30_084159 [Stylosanthes scabra]|uniref:Putative plant transposon protein domain-containing protein n=1 Tax=Stylosanthes scabra TaxID=79078 RepID=A0ABU6UV70_9FABA|nr:hypothetical protein [Stylosanthes scabra]